MMSWWKASANGSGNKCVVEKMQKDGLSAPLAHVITQQ
jgi:hypothetical protein